MSLYRSKLVKGDREQEFLYRSGEVIAFLETVVCGCFWVTKEHEGTQALMLNIAIVKEQFLPAIMQLGYCAFFVYFLYACFKSNFMVAFRMKFCYVSGLFFRC